MFVLVGLGVRGFVNNYNLNVCFANTVLQLLFHQPALLQELTLVGSSSSPGSAHLQQLAVAWRAPIVGPEPLSSQVRLLETTVASLGWRLGAHYDAAEFLHGLWESAFSEGVRRLLGVTFLRHDRIVNRDIVWHEEKDARASALWPVTVPFGDPVQLLDLLAATFTVRRQDLPEFRALVNASRESQSVVCELSQFLVIELNRNPVDDPRRSKVFTRVVVPRLLDFSALPSMSGRRPLGLGVYDLKGCALHHGHSLVSGHFTAIVLTEHGVLHCDDARVTVVDVRSVDNWLDMAAGHEQEGVAATLLLYERRTRQSQ